MPQFEHSRRMLLKAAISAVCSPVALSVASRADASSNTPAAAQSLNKSLSRLFISGARQSTDEHVAVVFDECGEILTTVPLSARAHGAAAHGPTRRACLFARRPGLYINTFDIGSLESQRAILPASGRNFYGHGTYSDAGDFLYATENDFDHARGVVGVYDANNGYHRIGEIASAGVGPHDIIRLPGSRLLVVANGGIETHPDSGREKLNIESMQPSLSIIDSHTGKLVGRHVLPDALHQVSIRHLAGSHDGEVWFAGQYEGTDPLVDGLVGVVSVEQCISSFQHNVSRKGLTLVELPASLQVNSLNYLTSVAVVGSHVIYTAAKGGLAFEVNRKTRQVEHSVSIFDCSGIASLPGSVPANTKSKIPGEAAIITTGTGEIVRLDDNGTSTIAMHPLQWDNHLYQLT